MKINNVYCLFEQSGTFKNEFKKFGINAEDYDIQDEFGQTDHICNLFEEIEKGYKGEPSIFDNIGDTDLVFAFFPCTRFESRIPLGFRGQMPQQKNQSDIEKLEYIMKLHEELHELYMLISKLFTICLRGGWKMIVENPYTQPHYLTSYFPIKPTLIDKDRRLNGDYFKKPTQYWFLNCKPESNLCITPLEWVQTSKIDAPNLECASDNRKTQRSMMHPQYAYRFIAQYIIESEGKIVR